MEGGDKVKDKGRATKLKSASSRRANAEENPHIKRARKKALVTQSDAAASDIVDAASDVTATSIVVPEPQAQSETQLDAAASTTLPGVATDDVDDRDNVAHAI
jgi:hypothetical protein